MPHTIRLALAAFLVAGTALATTYTVTSTADSGAGTLRQAILDANANPGADTIAFNIVGSGVQTITPSTVLPSITDAVTIDGYTQPGASPNTQPVGQGLDTVLKIEIAGQSSLNAGLRIQTQNVTIRGLAIHGFGGGQVDADTSFNTSNLVVEGCYLGTTIDGLTSTDSAVGVYVYGLNVRIGGLQPAERNLVSPSGNIGIDVTGSSTSGVVQGNLVGTDATGARRIASLAGGIGIMAYSLNGAVLIGGSAAGAANVIVGYNTGIKLDGKATTIQGNFIGVDAMQTGVIPGGDTGIEEGGQTTTGSKIGGTGPGEGNVIGGFDYGVLLARPVIFQGNFVGTDTTATRNFGNRIMGANVATSNLAIGGTGAGEANVIAFNGWVGLLVGSFATRNPIRGNRIFGNGVGGVGSNGVGMAIDLNFSSTPNGPNPNDPGDGDTQSGNEFQNYPMITSAVPEAGGTRIIGTLNSHASTLYDLDFYSNPACLGRPRDLPQAETYLGSAQVTTDASGDATFNVLLLAPIDAGAPVTGTATDPLGNTSELFPGIAFRIAPGVGGAGDTASQSLFGQMFDAGSVVTVGGSPVAIDLSSETKINFVGPALTPGGVYDVVVTNSGGVTDTLHNGYVSRFSDVAKGSLFDTLISKLVAGAITAGIGGGNYGPNNNVTRQQMAVFVLKAEHGVCYTPPPCQGVFSDVPCSSNFSPWIEQFAAEGITGGCGGGNYCPLNPVTRAQMAVFLLKAKYGSGFTPPPCAGVFADVTCPSSFAPWIEQLAAEGITGGCGGGNYCPGNINTRGQMAAFIVKAFSLP